MKALDDLNLGSANQSSSVQAVVDWFGPINFLTMDAQFKASGVAGQVHDVADSPESALLGGQLSKVPELVVKANPETYVSSDDQPFLIQHGAADILISTQQSIDFAALLSKTIGKDKVSYESLVGAGHGDAAFSTTANVKRALDFLDAYLKK